MIENELKARLQHAVEHTDNNTQYPANDSVPLNGEIVFNNTRTNFKVGNGSLQYSALSDFLPSIPAAQVNSDWNANSGVAQILNKPTTETWTFILSDGTSVTKNVLIST